MIHTLRAYVWAVLAGILAMTAVPGNAAPSPAVEKTPLNRNLVANASFEAPTTPVPDGAIVVRIPRWRTANNFTLSPYGAPNTPTPAKSKSIGGGKYFAFGGPGTARSTASQMIRLVGRAAETDAGKLTATVSAYMWSYDAQGDTAQVIVRFLDGSRKALKTLTTPRVAVAGELNRMAHKTVSAAVPKGTRFVKVMLVSVRMQGSYNDGAFDKVNVRLSRS